MINLYSMVYLDETDGDIQVDHFTSKEDLCKRVAELNLHWLDYVIIEGNNLRTLKSATTVHPWITLLEKYKNED